MKLTGDGHSTDVVHRARLGGPRRAQSTYPVAIDLSRAAREAIAPSSRPPARRTHVGIELCRIPTCPSRTS